ncbi:hypothetical protein [Aromatoleum petrolei]|uniref:Uncharacterized protein n=1 Tax=Aromatoleum petrolei TaxID=76116 RepID=A0ABX1MTZ4_9RHOO|nr:hypothetical protein [Aromatoleum petrolei]NMF91448.1 hypothetical protein [Aromatoleum petrolei]QTQ34622.1 Uncharacterized protein ToN1_04505 [Aromatoleum petrolei]
MLAAEEFPPLYVSGPLYRNRHDDFDALLEVQLRSRWNGWIDFFTQAVLSACDESMALVAQLAALRDDWNRRVVDRRADSASCKLVAALTGTPVVTVNQVKRLHGAPFPAANNAVADLASFGVRRAPRANATAFSSPAKRSRCSSRRRNRPSAIIDPLNGPLWGQAAGAPRRNADSTKMNLCSTCDGYRRCDDRDAMRVLSVIGRHDDCRFANPVRNRLKTNGPAHRRARFCRSFYNHFGYCDSLTA